MGRLNEWARLRERRSHFCGHENENVCMRRRINKMEYNENECSHIGLAAKRFEQVSFPFFWQRILYQMPFPRLYCNGSQASVV